MSGGSRISGTVGNAGNCVLCGKCLEVCPLLAATGREELAPRSKARLVDLLGADDETLTEKNAAAFDEKDAAALASLCLGCTRCREACSQGVDVPEAVSRLRAAHPGWTSWLWKQWMTRAKTLWPLTGKIASKLPNAGPERLSGLVKAARGLGRRPVEPFFSIKRLSKPPVTEALLFPGCAASFAAPYWTSAATALCSSLGVRLIEAEFSCCGASLHAAGLRRERLDAAKRNADLWRAGNRPRLITFCASCHAGLAAYAHDRSIFPDREEAEAWAEALTPLSGLLAGGLLNSDRFVVSPSSPEQAPRAIAYHRPCHTHGKDMDEALLRAMLGSMPNEDRLDISGECCGFGGVLQLGAPQLSRQVSDRCWTALAPKEGTLVLTGCTACVFQLAATAPEGVRAAHWLECIKLAS